MQTKNRVYYIIHGFNQIVKGNGDNILLFSERNFVLFL